MGSPPPVGSKKVVLIFRSVNNMVIPPAKTGSERTNKKVVKTTLQTNKGTRSYVKRGDRIFNQVQIKLIPPMIEEAPAKWRLKIAKSTLLPECPNVLLKGGYTVQPVPTPDSTSLEVNKSIRDGGKSQKLRLFIRGNDISGALINNGKNQFPKPPIKTGITIKKIIRKACAVTMVL